MPSPAFAPRGDFAAGFLTIAPLLVAVVVYGLLFGTLAAQKGLSPLEVAIMSATVFAGASSASDSSARITCRTALISARSSGGVRRCSERAYVWIS
jgi:hypothetical protein